MHFYRSLVIVLLAVTLLAPHRSAAEESVPDLKISTTSSKETPAHWRVEAKIFVNVAKETESADLLGLSLYHQPGSPHLRITIPQELMEQYNALSDDQARVAWLADRFKQQMEAGDESSADAYGVMLLYGLGVQQDWPAAREIFRKSVERGERRGAIFYTDLRSKDPDQPEASREVAAMLLPILKAGDYYPGWAVFEAVEKLEQSNVPEDRELADRLMLALEGAIFKGLASNPKNANYRKLLNSLSYEAGRRLLKKEKDKILWSLGMRSPDKAILERATKFMEGCVVLAPEHAESHLLLCNLLKMQGAEADEIYERTTHALTVSKYKPGWKHQINMLQLRGYQLAAAARMKKLSEVKTSDSSPLSDAEKSEILTNTVYIATASLLALGLLAVWTRCFRKKPAGMIPVFLWLPVAMAPSLLMLASVWVGLLFVPIALGLVIWAITGERVPLGYLASPSRGNGTDTKLWAQILVVCGALLLTVLVLDMIYLWAFREISGRQPDDFVIGLMLDYLRQHHLWGLVGGVAIVGILVGFIEEIAFRGFLFDWVKRFAPVWLTVVLTSVAFGLLHGLDAAIPTGISGAMLAWLRLRYNSLWPPIILHAVNNSIVFLILYFIPEVFGA